MPSESFLFRQGIIRTGKRERKTTEYPDCITSLPKKGGKKSLPQDPMKCLKNSLPLATVAVSDSIHPQLSQRVIMHVESNSIAPDGIVATGAVCNSFAEFPQPSQEQLSEQQLPLFEQQQSQQLQEQQPEQQLECQDMGVGVVCDTDFADLPQPCPLLPEPQQHRLPQEQHHEQQHEDVVMHFDPVSIPCDDSLLQPQLSSQQLSELQPQQQRGKRVHGEPKTVENFEE